MPRTRAGLDHFVQERLAAVNSALVRGAGLSGTLSDRIEELERDNRQLKLVVGCLLEQLVAKGLATREELTRLAEQIDALDGAADGGFDGQVTIQSGPGPKPPEAKRSNLDELKRAVEEG